MSRHRVASEMAALVLRSLESRGIEVEGLEERLGLSRSRTSGWEDWETFCDLVEQAGELVGGPVGLVALGRLVEEPAILGPLRPLLSLALGPRQLLRLLLRWRGPTAFPTIRTEFTEDGSVFEVRQRIVPDARGCAGFFHLSRGGFEATPALLGLPYALVEAEVDERAARYRIVLPPSATIWGRLRRLAAALRGSDAAVEELVGQHLALRETHEALRESEERYRRLAESAGEMIAEWGPAGGCLWVSPNVERLLGWTPEEFLRNPAALVHPEDRGEAMGRLGERFREGGRGTLLFRIRHRDGSWRWLDNTSNVARTTEGEPRVVTVSRDVTDRRDLEDQLRHAQKMEAVGRLAGGIAHDFNNILTVIKGWSGQLPESDAVVQIGEAVDRAAALTRRLLTISRRQAMALRPMRIEDCLRSMEPLLRRTMGDDIEIRVRIEPDLPPVRGDLGSLEQVVLNLAINARDAMPEGGAFEISATTRPGPEGASTRLALEFGDDGVGMEETTQSRVFEPFFSTKPMGTGSGLGLAMVWGIVQQMSGEVEVRSVPGEGSTFTVLLPTCEVEPESRRPEAPERPGARRGTECLLVVEDEDAVRRLAAESLGQHGYDVESAAAVEDALRVLERRGDVDLVITDVQMPGGSGFDLADELERRGRDLPVLFVSGYAPGLEEERIARLDGNLLPKPYSPDELAERVRWLLDRRGSPA